MKGRAGKGMRVLVWGCLSGLLAACASMGRPEGGARDELPPVYVRSDPAPGAVNVTPKRINVIFDENIQLEDAFSKVVVSPAQKTPPTVSSNGRRLTVDFRDTLQANTTYGENTGVLALSRVYDPRVIRIAACIAIVVSFCPKFAALVSAMPTATIGGVSLVLYGMISAVGVRNVVENKVDFTNTRNVIIAALILVLAIGITYSGSIQIGVVSLSGLAVSSIVGILLNAILPGKDYTFEQDDKGATSVDFKV